MGKPVIHFEMAVKDMAKSGKFYQDLFDWESKEIEGMGYTFVDTGADAGIKGGMFTRPDNVPGFVTVYVEVEDVAESLKKVKELGGSVMMEAKRVRPDLEVGLFKDPEGLIVGLMDQKQA